MPVPNPGTSTLAMKRSASAPDCGCVVHAVVVTMARLGQSAPRAQSYRVVVQSTEVWPVPRELSERGPTHPRLLVSRASLLERGWCPLVSQGCHAPIGNRKEHGLRSARDFARSAPSRQDIRALHDPVRCWAHRRAARQTSRAPAAGLSTLLRLRQLTVLLRSDDQKPNVLAVPHQRIR